MPTPGLTLAGFLPLDQGILNLRHSCVVADSSDAALTTEWTTANAKLGLAVAGVGTPNIQALPAAANNYVQSLMQNQWVHMSFQAGLLGAVFQMVEIQPLLAYQFHVDTARSDHHTGANAGPPTIDELLNICLPAAQPTEQIQVTQAPGSMLVTSPSLNFRTQAQGFMQGMFLGMQVGVSLPFVHVVRYNGRCYLHNGFHRAVGLSKRGATHMPCVFREVASPEAAGIQPPGTFELALLESPNPPSVGHFTQGKAHPIMLKTFRRTMHISWAEYATTMD